MPDMKLDDIIVRLGFRKVCDRVLRVCTPLERGSADNVPSPKHKNYKTALLEQPPPKQRTGILPEICAEVSLPQVKKVLSPDATRSSSNLRA